MMKRIILYISILLLSSFVSFAQNANFTVQITINDNGTIKDPVYDYGLTAADLSIKLADLNYPNCSPEPSVTEMWIMLEGYSFFFMDLDVFQSCGGWTTGHQIQLIASIHKPGSPLDGLSAECIFSASSGGDIKGEAGFVIHTKPVSNPLLEIFDFDSL